MAYRSIADRIEFGFDDESLAAFGLDYLKLLLDRWSEVARTLRRTGTLIVLLAVAFTLLVGAKSSAIVVGPLKITNVASVLPLIPAILSFLVYELIVSAGAVAMFDTVMTSLVERMHPTVTQNDLEYLLAPATGSLWGDDPWRQLRTNPPGRASRVLSALDAVGGVGLLFGSLVFEAFAFYKLYVHPHTNAVAVSVALLFAAFNVVRAVLLLTESGDY
ncbi:MAG: hypothetical protein ACJ760_12580 [Thermoleophilaceae bacterium]